MATGGSPPPLIFRNGEGPNPCQLISPIPKLTIPPLSSKPTTPASSSLSKQTQPNHEKSNALELSDHTILCPSLHLSHPEGIKLTPPKPSYLQVVKGYSSNGEPALLEQKPTQELDVESMDLKPISRYQGKPSVLFSAATKSQLVNKLKLVLVGKFSHGRPTMINIKLFFMKLKLKRVCNVSNFDKKHIFIECFCIQDFYRIWLHLNWIIDGFTMRIFKWSPDFSPLRECSIVPVWIRLQGLPLYLFDTSSLCSIANTVGHPIKVDARNVNRSMLNSARICVELDINKPLTEDVRISFFDEPSKNIVDGFWVKVFYDEVPNYCSFCLHLGHDSQMCKRKDSEIDVAQEEMPTRLLQVTLNGNDSPQSVQFPLERNMGISITEDGGKTYQNGQLNVMGTRLKGQDCTAAVSLPPQVATAAEALASGAAVFQQIRGAHTELAAASCGVTENGAVTIAETVSEAASIPVAAVFAEEDAADFEAVMSRVAPECVEEEPKKEVYERINAEVVQIRDADIEEQFHVIEEDLAGAETLSVLDEEQEQKSEAVSSTEAVESVTAGMDAGHTAAGESPRKLHTFHSKKAGHFHSKKDGQQAVKPAGLDTAGSNDGAHRKVSSNTDQVVLDNMAVQPVLEELHVNMLQDGEQKQKQKPEHSICEQTAQIPLISEQKKVAKVDNEVHSEVLTKIVTKVANGATSVASPSWADLVDTEAGELEVIRQLDFIQVEDYAGAGNPAVSLSKELQQGNPHECLWPSKQQVEELTERMNRLRGKEPDRREEVVVSGNKSNNQADLALHLQQIGINSRSVKQVVLQTHTMAADVKEVGSEEQEKREQAALVLLETKGVWSALEETAIDDFQMFMASPKRIGPVFARKICSEVVRNSPKIKDVRKQFKFLSNKEQTSSLVEQGKLDDMLKDAMNEYTKEIYQALLEHDISIYPENSITEKVTPQTQEAILKVSTMDEKEWSTPKRRGRNRTRTNNI